MRHLLTTLLLCWSAAALAVAPARFQAASPSTVLLRGTSNVADWRCSGTTIHANVEVDSTLAKINEVIDRIEDGNVAEWVLTPDEARFPQPRFSMAIAIQSLRCGNRIMESDLRSALKAASHPAIEFRFTGLDGSLTRDIDRDLFEAEVLGEISAAGVKRQVRVTVVAQRVSGTRFRLRAELPLRMTDFGITPPTALFGLVKANDDLKIRFDLLLQPAPADKSLEAHGSQSDPRSGS